MKPTLPIATALVIASAAVVAQPGAGSGDSASPATKPPAGAPAPAGKGPRWQFDAGNTPGWSMMTSQERARHHAQMLDFRTHEECAAYLEEHHRQMAARARDRGRPAPDAPRQNMCARMREAGRLR